VKLLSSLLDVPAQLALVLTLAASGPGNGTPTAPTPLETAAIASAQTLVPQPLEGPYRFSESNWLRVLREDLPAGEAQGSYSARIFKTSGGRYYVPIAAERRQILEARANAALAGRAAEGFATDNAARLRVALQRPATAGELYIAHLFGPEAAIDFIQLADARPNDLAAKQVSGLAQSAPELATDGAQVTLGQLYRRLTEPMRKFARSAGAQAAVRARSREQAAPLDLKPTIGEVLQAGGAADAFVWHAEVSASRSAVVPQ
jgi:hypothetical protein